MKNFVEILKAAEEIKRERERAVQAARLIHLSEVLFKTGLSRSRLYALMRDSLFPASIRLCDDGRSVRWIESEVDSWINNRISSSRVNAAS
jgi:predicted DNA-binding transcriptional regulator AlpA